MTTYTTISNSSLAVGAIPSSSIVTALRDNVTAAAEAANGAPINVAGWHPVDKVTVGDGKNGLIFDAAVNTGVTNIVTPNFVDGYEYRIVCIGLGHSAGSTRNMRLELFKETSAAFVSAWTTGFIANTVRIFLESEIPMPRINSQMHFVRYALALDAAPSTTTVAGCYNATSQKVLKAQLTFQGGTDVFTAGKVYLFRHRDYASSP